MDIFSMIKMMMGKKTNPQQLAMNMIKNSYGNNPMMNNLIDMAEKGNVQGVEQFARNFCQGSGRNFDKEYAEFIKKING